jgi:hypothetical protein
VGRNFGGGGGCFTTISCMRAIIAGVIDFGSGCGAGARARGFVGGADCAREPMRVLCDPRRGLTADCEEMGRLLAVISGPTMDGF